MFGPRTVKKPATVGHVIRQARPLPLAYDEQKDFTQSASYKFKDGVARQQQDCISVAFSHLIHIDSLYRNETKEEERHKGL